jgi:hypothetical protein
LIIKLTPFCAESMIASFMESVRNSEYRPHATLVILACFAFLSRLVAPSFHVYYSLFEGLSLHFTIDSPTFSEYTASIIETLGNMGLDWIRRLFTRISQKLPLNPSRHVIRTLSALIAFDQGNNKLFEAVPPCLSGDVRSAAGAE